MAECHLSFDNLKALLKVWVYSLIRIMTKIIEKLNCKLKTKSNKITVILSIVYSLCLVR